MCSVACMRSASVRSIVITRRFCRRRGWETALAARRLRRSILPITGLNVVPQLMSKNADEFVWAAQVLADMGYREVNLNLGCPSGTVVAKGKGSGFLRNLDELEAFLSDVCERSPLPVSVKTRLGLERDDEYERVLDLYCRMPLAELHCASARTEGPLYGLAAQGVLRRDAGACAVSGGL